MKFIFTTTVIFISIGVLVYFAKYSVSIKAIPSLDEFIASSTAQLDSINIIKKPVVSVSSLTGSSSPTVLLPVYTPKGKILAYTAKNPTTRQLGLSGYESLDANKGMLFIFPEAGKYDFWMKDMNFSIDIVWIRDDKTIIGVEKNISPKTYPKSFIPPGEIQFVLELNAGAAEIFGLATGKRVSF